MKIVLFSIGAVAVVWAIDAALNPWALHMADI